ncbi:uncharacterized protein EDB93DRAFT_1147627 [Suillus bovinus]|uniref:uncharacterized protein n=1 Tax=Suillus bovinus TaxID=48563 RepID=UPI001B8752A9|nr:uncharacterized protein EDB93DRAFT_1147627 [Suillus bovinus]KAG2147490.1 hypothetical protein EDB93DRAFT_1147627 [Suillus bovinus]
MPSTSPVFDEKLIEESSPPSKMYTTNPVISSAEFVLEQTNIVKINDDAVKKATQYILQKVASEPYTSAFWSEKEGQLDRYGVEWRASWNSQTTTVHTGYWSLVAALNRALEEGIPIIDPQFYSSEALCPDSLIAHVFRPAPQSSESIPLLNERLAIMREVGAILCNDEFGGSYLGFLQAFQRRYENQGTALDLVQFVTDSFPSFRDDRMFNGRRVYFWKRSQILVAETWAAFYPESPYTPHPIFPGLNGACISSLTMFADYRLCAGTQLESGSREEMSLRAASIVAVERIRSEMVRCGSDWEASCVLIDFYLWDLAKKLQGGKECLEGIETEDILPVHRTRSIWY